MPVRRVPHRLSRVARFVVSGGLATSIHWGVMTVLVTGGAPSVGATAAGATAGAIANYFLQFHYTFRSAALHRRAVPAYATATLLGWLANIVIFLLLQSEGRLSAAPAQVLTSAMVTLLNFSLYKWMVFHEKPLVLKRR